MVSIDEHDCTCAPASAESPRISYPALLLVKPLVYSLTYSLIGSLASVSQQVLDRKVYNTAAHSMTPTLSHTFTQQRHQY